MRTIGGSLIFNDEKVSAEIKRLGDKMNGEIRYTPLGNFDFSVLNDPEYGEDAVREEILSPIINSLGYSSNGHNKIVRSRKLKHPYVSIGSQQKNISIVPDYVMEINGTPSWILEAKSPKEVLLNSKHSEQAYSYAIHPEIRAKYYALCNGREFLLYSVDEFKPKLYFDLCMLSLYWCDLKDLLSAETLIKNIKKGYAKDYGLHLKRLGFDKLNLYYYEIPVDFIAKMNNNLYTFATGIGEGEDSYCVSFDFSHEVLLKLKGKIQNGAYEKLKMPLQNNTMLNLEFQDMRFFISVACHVGNEIQENDKELFLPLIVTEIL